MRTGPQRIDSNNARIVGDLHIDLGVVRRHHHAVRVRVRVLRRTHVPANRKDAVDRGRVEREERGRVALPE
jgi:hypothetical protein